MGKNQHIVPHNDGWAVRGAGNSRVTKQFDTQAQASERGREIARNEHSEMLIHGRDGQIREKNTYGKDKFPPRG